MAKKKGKKIIWTVLLIVILFGGGFTIYMYKNNEPAEVATEAFVLAEKGTIVEKALAVGAIEPENEIEVKSKISGVVSRIYADAGDYVKKGDPLIEVNPNPTPLELAEAKRALERTIVERDQLAKEMERMQSLKERNLISEKDYENIKQQYDDSEIRVQINEERLQLLETGRITIDNTLIESVIRAPISGYILEKPVDVGQPIVPLTSYQAGTPLMTLAEMDNLLFKGTVDEIDIGKIELGMPAVLKIGALPNDTISGYVSRISLKAIVQDNATVFPIEIMITETNGATLRAGFSANADIIIKKMEDVLTIPERVIIMRDDKAYVEIPGSEPGSRVEKEIKIGMSDAITVAVTSGLEEGEKVLEKPLRSLTIR